MANLPVSPVGGPLEDYVNNQIKSRQKVHGSGLEGTRSSEEITYLNGKNAWIKMASSVDLDPIQGKERLAKLGFTNNQADDLLGSALARQFVLFNGTSKFGEPLQRSGVSNTTNPLNTFLYGTGGNDFGLQAMPGITSFEVGHNNIGSIRTGKITIRANSRNQYNLIELLYIRLGYNMLIEWGNNIYYDNNNRLTKMGSTLIDEGDWFKKQDVTHLQFNSKIEEKRKQYQGNYDAFFCTVTNFEWNFNKEGYYEITLHVINQGSVIESLLINKATDSTYIPQSTEEGTLQAEANRNALLNKFYCLRKTAAKSEGTLNTEKGNSDYVFITQDENTTEAGKFLNNKNPDTDRLYYIRFGSLIEWIQENIMVNIKCGESPYFGMVEVNTTENNYFRLFPGLMSTNPYKCYIKNNLTQKFKKTRGGDDKNMMSQYQPVPYNIGFTLYAMAKNSDDALQIVEQILPYFQPDYTVTLNLRPTMDIVRDVPIILNDVTYEDSYEGDFSSRRVLMYTLNFTTKNYLYGPVTSQKVIKSVQVDQYSDMPVNTPKREQRYTVTPDPVDADGDDNFGFNETTSFFQDAKDFNPATGSDE